MKAFKISIADLRYATDSKRTAKRKRKRAKRTMNDDEANISCAHNAEQKHQGEMEPCPPAASPYVTPHKRHFAFHPTTAIPVKKSAVTILAALLFLFCLGAVDCRCRHNKSPSLVAFVTTPFQAIRPTTDFSAAAATAAPRLFFSSHLSTCINNNGGDSDVETMTAEQTTSSTTNMQTTTPATLFPLETAATTIRNFRPTRGLTAVYRCGSTDCLADVIVEIAASSSTSQEDDDDNDESKRVLSFQKGLILDLRSASERDEVKAQQWMSLAPGGSWKVVDLNDQQQQQDQQPHHLFTNNGDNTSASCDDWRIVVRLDVLHPERFAEYANQNWLQTTKLDSSSTGSSSSSSSSSSDAIDKEKEMHLLRMDELNKRGLLGLNQAILETGKVDFCTALKAITQFRECHFPTAAAAADVPVVIHCVQGKDRTGVLIMLCQSLIGVSDDDIIADYHQSTAMLALSPEKTSAAAQKVGYGRLDRRIFSEAPAQVMQETLAWMRDRYGSIEQGYFDSIGFDESWRQRFKRVVVGVVVNGETSSSRL